MAGIWNCSRVRGMVEDLGIVITQENDERGILVGNNEASGVVNMVFDCSGEVLEMEQIVSLTPEANREAFFLRLLQMNREAQFGAFATDAQARVIIFRASHPFDRLTIHMIETSLRGLEQALKDCGPELAAFHKSP